MNPRKKQVIFVLVLAAAVILIWRFGHYQEEMAKLSEAPEFLIHDLENQPLQLSDFKGKVLLINFWATWCPPCIEEIPHLEKLFNNYSKKGLVVLGVSLDEAGREHVKSFVKENALSYPIAMSNEKMVKDFGGIRGTPTSFLIDREGKIVKKWVGYRDYDYFESLVKGML